MPILSARGLLEKKMDSFSEKDREVLLQEIKKIKAALKPDESLSHIAGLYADVESDVEGNKFAAETSGDECGDSDEDYIPDVTGYSKASTAWYEQDDGDENSEDADHFSQNIISRTQSVIQQNRKDMSTPSSFPFTPLTPATEITDLAGNDVTKLVPNKQENIQIALTSTDHQFLSSVECALQLNREYQKIVDDELIKIKCALENNRKMQSEIESRKSLDKDTKKQQIFLARFKKSYFKDMFGQGPPDNEDTKEKNEGLGISPFATSPRLWTEKERQLLAKGVRNQNLERLTFQLKAKLNRLEREAKKEKKEVDEQLVADIKKQMADLRKLPNKQLEENLEELDFFQISKLYLPKRTESECRIRWLVSDHPRINQSPWTKEEDMQLIHLAQKHKKRGWENIAREMGTLRTPIQCFQRYQRSLNKTLLKRGWTPEENQELRRIINICPKGNWQSVANLIDGRTAMQILHHWSKVLKPGIVKGPWSSKENALLLKYTELCGVGNWSEISKYIPGRTDAAVRERWTSQYVPGLKLRVPWEKEEDAKLLAGVAEHGAGNWSKIANDIEGRTDNMCWSRWKTIQKDEYKKYQKKLAKKRQLLNYFVGRNHERPDLDFEKLEFPSKLHKKKKLVKKRKEGSKAESETETGNTSKQNDAISSNENTSIQNQESNDAELITESNEEYTYVTGSSYEEEDSDSDDSTSSKSTKIKHLVLNEDECKQFLESGDNILLAFDNGDAEYVDVKRELFLLKLKILKNTSGKTRIKLQEINEKQFESLESIRLRGMQNEKESLSNSSDDELKSIPIRNTKLLKMPNIPIEDTVFGPENIGVRSVRPVELGHMPANLAPFTLLLEAFHIDVTSVMKAIQTPASTGSAAKPSQTATVTSSDTTKSTAAPQSSSGSNTNTAGSLKDESTGKSSRLFHSIIPIAPNLVTLRAFRKLLLHRRRLVELASLLPPSMLSPSVSQTTLPSQMSACNATETPPNNVPVSSTSFEVQTNADADCGSNDINPSKSGLKPNERNSQSSTLSPNAKNIIEEKSTESSHIVKETTFKGGAGADGSHETTKRMKRKVVQKVQTKETVKDKNTNKTDDKTVNDFKTSETLKGSQESRVETSYRNKLPVSQKSPKKVSKPAYQHSYEFQAVSARFNGLFLWPALLSTHVARMPVLRSGRKRGRKEAKEKPKGKTECPKAQVETSTDSEEIAEDCDEAENDDYEPSKKVRKENDRPISITKRSLRTRKRDGKK